MRNCLTWEAVSIQCFFLCFVQYILVFLLFILLFESVLVVEPWWLFLTGWFDKLAVQKGFWFFFSFWGWGVFRDYSLVSNCVRNAPDVLMCRPWKLIKCSEKLLRTLHKKPVLCCVYSVGTVPPQCDCMRRVINIYS